MNLDPNIVQKLKDIINNFEPKDNANRNFLIQYTVFDNDGGDEWYMNCILSESCDEGIYESSVEYADETKILFDSWKGNYDEFNHTIMSDNRGMSNDTYIYACDLYDGFQPKNYKGYCMTRGGFTGWNWFKIQE
jgi:hypothetical protein